MILKICLPPSEGTYIPVRGIPTYPAIFCLFEALSSRGLSCNYHINMNEEYSISRNVLCVMVNIVQCYIHCTP